MNLEEADLLFATPQRMDALMERVDDKSIRRVDAGTSRIGTLYDIRPSAEEAYSLADCC